MSGEAHVWMVSLPEVEEDVTVLDPREKRRAERFLRPADRERYVRSHVALRRILARCVECEAREISFTADEHGKPALEPGTWAFSLSHSGERALIGVAPSPIGVDIEWLRADLDYREIARSRLDPLEQRAIDEAGTRDKALEHFFRAWTRHEAAGKAAGQGLSADRATLAEFRAENIEAPPGYAAAVATPVRARSALTLHRYPES